MLSWFQVDAHVTWRKRLGSPHLERLGNEFEVEPRILSTLEGGRNPKFPSAKTTLLNLGGPLESSGELETCPDFY